jgi:hypothetical protein
MKFEEIIQPGNAVRRLGYLLHIRAIVDEEYVVYKVWSRNKGRWAYHVEWIYGFELWYNDNKLELVKRGEK